jgi:2-polyprenyl-3-methyl-5-hydroxy-6-metoxy-1,4-benzoquinol methylase
MSFDQSLYDRKTVAYYDHPRAEMLEFVPPGVGSVLDIGCSSGGFGRLLKEKLHCEVWGIEPTDAAKTAADHLDKVFQDYFSSSLDFGNKQFDAIIFNDVLEHLVNPWEALTLSRSLLTDKGCIVASIPNVQCYTVVKDLILKGNWKYMASGIMDKTHLRFFTRNSIIDLFHDTGYEVKVIKGQNSIRNNSRLLKTLHFLMPKRVAPFLYINYAVCAYPRI